MPTETVSTRAVLTFVDGHGHRATVSIPRARLDKSSSEASESMTTMIESGALEFKNIETVRSPYRAKLVSTARTRML